MEAYRIEDSFGLDNLNRVEVDRPEPGPGEVLVEIEAVSLNFRDWMTVQGMYNPDQPLPLIPCSDACGTVREVGSDVDSFEEGDRVIPIFAQDWLEGPLTAQKRSSTLGGPLPGTLAEFQTFAETGLVRTPENLSPVEASTLPCAGVTAWTALTEFGSVTAGDTVLLQGTGGVSTFGLELATTLGAEVIITSSSDDKLDIMRERGADHTINYRDNPDWHKTVMDITGGDGADCILEVGGEETLEKSLQCVAFEGTVALIGVLSGGQPTLTLASALMRRATVQGILVGSRENTRDFARAVEHNNIQPLVDGPHEWDEGVECFERMRDGEHLGKIVVERS